MGCRFDSTARLGDSAATEWARGGGVAITTFNTLSRLRITVSPRYHIRQLPSRRFPRRGGFRRLAQYTRLRRSSGAPRPTVNSWETLISTPSVVGRPTVDIGPPAAAPHVRHRLSQLSGYLLHFERVRRPARSGHGSREPRWFSWPSLVLLVPRSRRPMSRQRATPQLRASPRKRRPG